MLHDNDLKDKARALRAATGWKQDEFEALRNVVEASYAQAYPADRTVRGQARQRGTGAGNKGTLRRMDDKLLFILVDPKPDRLQTMFG